MRKSVRIYINQDDINNGSCRNGYLCPIARAIGRSGLLKGRSYCVDLEGIFIAPNRKTIDKRIMDSDTPQIRLSKKGMDFVETFDYQGFASPTHVTLIDESGKYL
jgi:hypothetical protein